MAGREVIGPLTERLLGGLGLWVLVRARAMVHESRRAKTFFPETAGDGQALGHRDSAPWRVHYARRRHCIQELQNSVGATEVVVEFRVWTGRVQDPRQRDGKGSTRWPTSVRGQADLVVASRDWRSVWLCPGGCSRGPVSV